jgi:hypothetical protein
MAKEKISRGQPCASEIGTVKKPKAERMPKLTTATRQPATISADRLWYQAMRGALSLLMAFP